MRFQILQHTEIDGIRPLSWNAQRQLGGKLMGSSVADDKTQRECPD
jgi:hypothetical protein